MKRSIFIAVIFIVFWCMPYNALAVQKVEVVNSVFTFDPVPEGVHVSHEFIIKNTGDVMLNILSVLPP